MITAAGWAREEAKRQSCIVELSNDFLMQRLGGQHLRRIVDLVHERFRRAIEFVHLQSPDRLVVVNVEMNLKAVHVFFLVIGLNVVGLFRASIRDLLSPVTLEIVEGECVVAVEGVCAVLPDELSRDTIWLCRVGIVKVERLLPVAIVCETV